MKRILAVVLLLPLCLAVFACAHKKAPSQVVGGYTEERDLTAEDAALFAAAAATVDASYEPLKVATQVVAGTNYRFYCKAPDAQERYVYITVFVPLGEGEPAVMTNMEDAEG
ncbi:MAG: hypothetical protein LBN26_00065 [Christensenellaceae bacterium]|jgi:hypothetical protein|nr:hypothetical protein [Christensenellaceae bacterium]